MKKLETIKNFESSKIVSFDIAIDQLKEMVDNHRGRVIIGIHGYPNSGKTYFVRKFMERFSSSKRISSFNNPEDIISDQWSVIRFDQSDIVFIHFPDFSEMDPSKRGVDDYSLSRTIHKVSHNLHIVIYNPALYEVGHRDLSGYDLIIENPDSLKKL